MSDTGVENFHKPSDPLLKNGGENGGDIANLLTKPRTFNQEVFNWLQSQEGREKFFSKIDVSILKKRLKKLAENPSNQTGLKELFTEDEHKLRQKLAFTRTDRFFLSLLSNQIEAYVDNNFPEKANGLNINQIKTLIDHLSNCNYILETALVEYFNFRDEKTNIWNKRALEAVYAQEIAEDEKSKREKIYTFVFFDIDRFKKVNDNFDHYTGDEAIIALSKAAKKVFGELARPRDMIARLSGDEFGAMFKIDKSKLETDEAKRVFSRRIFNIFKKIETSYQEYLEEIIVKKEIGSPQNIDGQKWINRAPFVFGDTISIGYCAAVNPRENLDHYLMLAEQQVKAKKEILRQEELNKNQVEAATPEPKNYNDIKKEVESRR